MPTTRTSKSKAGKKVVVKKSKYSKYVKSSVRTFRGFPYIGPSSSEVMVKIPWSGPVRFHVDNGDHVSYPLVVMPWAMTNNVNPTASAITIIGPTSSLSYQKWTDLFDQVRCEGVTCKASLLQPFSTTATAWDVAFDMCCYKDRRVNPDETGWSDYTSRLSSLDILRSPGLLRQPCLPNCRNVMSLSLWADPGIERSQFIDEDWHGIGTTGTYEQAWFENKFNTNLFSPGLWLIMRTPNLVSSLTGVDILVQLDCNFYFIFKNPRFHTP